MKHSVLLYKSRLKVINKCFSAHIHKQHEDLKGQVHPKSKIKFHGRCSLFDRTVTYLIYILIVFHCISRYFNINIYLCLCF